MRKVYLFLLLFTSFLTSQTKETYTPLQMLYFASQPYEDQMFKDRIPEAIKVIYDISGVSTDGFYEDKKSDYQAIAMRDSIENIIIVAHRGTEFNKLKDLYTDIQIIYSNIEYNKRKKKDSVEIRKFKKYMNELINPQLKQYFSAMSFTDSLKQKYPQEEYSYIHVGHSLGGAIAQLIGAQTKDKTVTFDAPGVEGIAESLSLSKTELDIVNYVVKNSAISNWKNMTRGHIGRIEPIYPYIPHNLIKNNPLGAGKYHSIVNLAEAFDQKTGGLISLEAYAKKAWDDNKIQQVKKTIGKPQKKYNTFEEFCNFYVKRYIYKTNVNNKEEE